MNNDTVKSNTNRKYYSAPSPSRKEEVRTDGNKPARPARLVDSLTSSYFSAAHKLYSKKARRRIIAYVESYDDVAFWRTLLEEFEDDERYFQVMLPSATSLAKGKKMVLMNTLNTAELGKSLIACVDSDCKGQPTPLAKSTGTNIFFKHIHMLLRTIIALRKVSMKYVYNRH